MTAPSKPSAARDSTGPWAIGAFVAILIGGAFASVVLPVRQILPTFDWHLGTDETRHGALEAVTLLALLAAAFALRRRRLALALASIPALLFARRHAIDIPLLLDLFQLEVTIGLGMIVRHRVGLAPVSRAFDFVEAFVAGLLVWSLCAWTASALGFGSIQALRWLTLLLALPVVFARRTPLLVFLWRTSGTLSTGLRIWSAALVAWILVLFARTKTAIGFDSAWYGLQGQHVLAPGDTVFESLGLVSPVHYYPKLQEMFLLPLSGLGDTSVVLGMSILMLVLLLVTAETVLRQLQVPTAARLPTLAVLATLPALANVSGETKPDVLAVLFVMIALLHALAFVRARSTTAAVWIGVAGALACCTKLTAIPYVGMLVLATLAATARQGRAAAVADVDIEARRFALVVATIALPVIALVCARTLVLTGLPTIGPDPLFALWHSLGFTLAEPGGTLGWTLPQDWGDVPALFLDWTFRPQNLPHVVITWVGNVWLWLPLVAVAAGVLLRPRWTPHGCVQLLPALALVATGFVLAFGIRYLVRGSDGNYFLFALLPAILLGASAVFRRLEAKPALTTLALGCLAAIGAMQAGVSFISGAWTPGTRAWDLQLDRSWRSKRKSDERVLVYWGLNRIADHLREAPGRPRAIGALELDVAFSLPARFEDLATISYSRPAYVRDADALLHYMQRYDIRYVVMPRADAGISAPFVDLLAEMAERVERVPGVVRVEDQRYVMYDLVAVEDRDWPGITGAAATPGAADARPDPAP